MNRAKRALITALRRFIHPDQKETRQFAWIMLAMILMVTVAANDLPLAGPAQTLLTPTASVILTPQPPLGSPTSQAASPSPTATPTVAVPDQNETDGMIIGGIVLVLIIVGGTLQVLRPRSPK